MGVGAASPRAARGEQRLAELHAYRRKCVSATLDRSGERELRAGGAREPLDPWPSVALLERGGYPWYAEPRGVETARLEVRAPAQRPVRRRGLALRDTRSAEARWAGGTIAWTWPRQQVGGSLDLPRRQRVLEMDRGEAGSSVALSRCAGLGRGAEHTQPGRRRARGPALGSVDRVPPARDCPFVESAAPEMLRSRVEAGGTLLLEQPVAGESRPEAPPQSLQGYVAERSEAARELLLASDWPGTRDKSQELLSVARWARHSGRLLAYHRKVGSLKLDTDYTF